ncbi:Hsp20/alpha crystallin family protein [Actinomycetospora callitridis]|uniref:Hsp20/alpha crystallin family protein n=1 Tax=Actinomycetospora callitridis TaxID=913944 RepID=UPI002366CD67|nr:Hsp20/alpha crystallin family protein [Actinomycetospora callitridis]MDD7918818.1 Hsp20/alpha crystallin family protein [Actinomycetospora callitridis]
MAITKRGRRAATQEPTDDAAATTTGTSTETATTATAEGATDTAQPTASGGVSGALRRGARAVVGTLSAPVSDSLLGRHPRMTTIAVDERVEDDAVVVDAELPGFAPGDITVAAEGGQLFLHAVREADSENARPDAESRRRRERRTGIFHRELAVPPDTDPSTITASYAAGVLTVRMPLPTPRTPTERVEIPVRHDERAPGGETDDGSPS